MPSLYRGGKHSHLCIEKEPALSLYIYIFISRRETLSPLQIEGVCLLRVLHILHTPHSSYSTYSAYSASCILCRLHTHHLLPFASVYREEKRSLLLIEKEAPFYIYIYISRRGELSPVQTEGACLLCTMHILNGAHSSYSTYSAYSADCVLCRLHTHRTLQYASFM